MSVTHPKPSTLNVRVLIVATILHAYFYACMEWLFFVTKPSSLSLISVLEKILVLFVTGGIIALASLVLLASLSLPAILIKDPIWQRRLIYLACLAPAFFLSLNALLLFDNFTYTVLKFGIISTTDNSRGFYTAGFIVFLLWMTRQIHRRVYKRRKPASLLTVSLLAVSIILILTVTFSRPARATASDSTSGSSHNYPNIIIIGGDGLSDRYLSVYGYSKDTTPFLKEMAKDSLVAENAFTNVSSTTASTTSMLTGRMPMDVQVFRYPDILSGDDSFKHLPGILKQRGYQTVEIGTPDYVDAQRLNLLEGFDIVNNRSQNQPILNTLQKLLGNSPSAFFSYTVIERASDRLLHIFFIREMHNPTKEVNDSAAGTTDKERVAQIFDLLDHSDHPLFIFTHFMDTHGPHFSSDKQVFSTGESTDEEWDKARYEDAILSFDGSVERIYQHLEETGQLDNTILVIYTDHGFMYTVYNRIPIIIHFPQGEHAGTRINNLQIIDVAPTLLEYLGIPQPAWMTGTSFLNTEPPADREIISIVAGSPSKIKPPFYQIKIVQYIVCQRYYALNVQENKLTTSSVAGHTAPCDEKSLPQDNDIRQKILAYLEQYGYDISSLK